MLNIIFGKIVATILYAAAKTVYIFFYLCFITFVGLFKMSELFFSYALTLISEDGLPPSSIISQGCALLVIFLILLITIWKLRSAWLLSKLNRAVKYQLSFIKADTFLALYRIYLRRFTQYGPTSGTVMVQDKTIHKTKQLYPEGDALIFTYNILKGTADMDIRTAYDNGHDIRFQIMDGTGRINYPPRVIQY